MSKKIQDCVVVITGASSGIGRATALAFAKKGATVVAAARREEPLDKLVQECKALGAQALAIPTDMTDSHAVHRLARAALEHFHRIDVWVNNLRRHHLLLATYSSQCLKERVRAVAGGRQAVAMKPRREAGYLVLLRD